MCNETATVNAIIKEETEHGLLLWDGNSEGWVHKSEVSVQPNLFGGMAQVSMPLKLAKQKRFEHATQ